MNFSPEDETRRELVKIALFCAQELSAALTEIEPALKCDRLDWIKIEALPRSRSPSASTQTTWVLPAIAASVMGGHG